MCLKSLQRLKLNIIKVNTRLQSKPVLETVCGLVRADFAIALTILSWWDIVLLARAVVM